MVKDGVLQLTAWLARRLPPGLRHGLYRLGPVTGAIRGALNRAAPQGKAEVAVATGPLQGARFMLDMQQEKALWLGNFEPELLATMQRVLRPGMTVYDVGANLGYLTVAIGRLVGPNGAVHAFEPLPANLSRLRDSIRRNGIEGRVTVVPAAVGGQSGTERFLRHASGGMGKLASASGRQASYQGELEVSVVSLDDYVFEQGEAAPDWIKIDVEGGEAGVMAGAQRLLTARRPGLLLEIHGPEAAGGVWRALATADYSLSTLTGRAVLDVAELEWKAYLLATPSEAQEPGLDA